MKTLLNLLSLLALAAVLGGTARLHGNVDDASHAAAPFAAFPLGEPRTVEFQVNDGELEALSPRERADQYRDWLLFAVAGTAGLSPEELNEATFDLPAVRAGFMRALGNLEFGETRSLYTGDGTVAALVPAGAGADERLDLLGEVADRHRKNLGILPDSVAVFEYAFAADSASAAVTRRPAVPAQVLFGARGGYHERRITRLEDLRAFMDSVDDVTHGRLDGGTLVLGGRALRGRPYRGIRVEDVAAIWSSAGAEARQGSGFSLDPAYDYPELAKIYEQDVGPALVEWSQLDGFPLAPGEIGEVGAALRAADTDPYFAMMGRLRDTGNEELGALADALLEVSQTAQFQVARYDGDLQGTEVGMVLFYTDLLAKLWALDYLESTPRQAIPGLTALPGQSVSPIYRQQLDSLNNTRLWFGPRDAGFQLARDGNSLLMERAATRVFAASASGFTPGVEAPANAASEAFLGWWNDHYDEVARHEPEYERLNQIMKWSLLVGWLNQSGSGALGFLGDVPVDRSGWFPDWAARHPELRYDRWSRIGFYPRGHRGSGTEALPRLLSAPYSQFGERGHQLSGGVSLGGRQTFHQRPRLSTSVPPLRRRSTLNYGAWDEGTGALSTVDGWAYRLTAERGGRMSVVTSTPPTVRFRGARGELARGEVQRMLASDASGLHVETSAGGRAVGDLRVSPTPTGFRAAWRGRDVARGQALARQVSMSPNPTGLLRDLEELDEAFELPGGGYMVRMQGSRQWMKLQPERVNTVELAAGWDARVAGVDGRPQLVAWLDDAAARAELARGTPTRLRRERGFVPPDPVEGDPRAAALDAARDPADFRRRGELHLRGRLDASDELARAGRHDRALAELDELPSPYQHRPDVVMRRAVYELALNRPGAAASALGQARPAPLHDRDRFFDEINTRIRHAARDGEADALRQVAGVMDWNDGLAAGSVEGRLALVQDGPRLATRLEREALRGVPAGAGAIDEIARGEAVLYVQDAPGLNNLDWHPGTVGGTLRDAISGRRGRLQALPDGGLSHFRPARIYAQAQGAEYRLRAERAADRPRDRVNYVARPRERCADEGERRARAPRGEAEECRRVYVLTVG